MDHERLRVELTATKRDIEERMASHRESANLSDSMRDEISELSLVDNHPADVASELFLRGMSVGDRVRDEAHLADIEAALERMDAGMYGECGRCGQAIPMDRLSALPTAKYCMGCQTIEEKRMIERHRPIEEEVLYPGFGAVWLDDQDQTAFDGEDAYQAVERYNERLHEDTIYEQMPLDDNTGIVDPIDDVSQSEYERGLPPPPTYRPQ